MTAAPTTVFRLDSSIRIDGSVTRAVSDTLQSALLDGVGGAAVIHRDLGVAPLPSDAWATAAFAGFVPEGEQSAEQARAVGIAHELADELAAADVAILGVPLYNWGVPQHVKTWFDLVLTDPRFGAAGPGVGGKPAFLVIARGGGYGEGTPRYGWDHATGWLRRILADVWGFDVQVIEAELTLAEGNPAMADLVDAARASLAAAHADAASHGEEVARRLTAA